MTDSAEVTSIHFIMILQSNSTSLPEEEETYRKREEEGERNAGRKERKRDGEREREGERLVGKPRWAMVHLFILI